MLDRQRRRPGRERDDAREDAPAAENAILALQRTAGNRAVQRLVHDKRTDRATLKVPPAYANQVIAWNGTEIPDNPTPQQKQSFIQHARNPGFVEAVKKGLWIHSKMDGIEESTQLKPDARGHLTNPLKGVTAERQVDIRATLDQQLAAAAESHNQLLTIPKDQFTSVGQVEQAIRPVLSPDDYLPEASDLPSADTDLATTEIPGGEDKVKYITYACVLIALLKDDGGVARAQVLTKNANFPAEVIAGTQALHTHYRKKNIEYDQRSTAERLMREDWGYKLLWTGSSKWGDLYKEVGLKPGKYVVDIEGHTVMTEVLTEVTKGTPMGDISKVFKHNSESSNYTLSHWEPKVTAIWKK
jgi:hypothetical protein